MKDIKDWKNLTNTITENWIREYFDLEYEEVYVDLVASDIGGIFEFADMFFNFSDVLNCYKYNISKENLFLWYDYCLENQFINISLAKFILSPEEKREQEEKYLKELRQRVVEAEEILNKAMEEYKL